MNDTSSLALPEAARRLGVSVRVMRQAARAGRLPALPHGGAVALVSAEWLSHAEAAVKQTSGTLRGVIAQRVPAFARYGGTSAWRKYTVRVKAFNAHRAAEAAHARG